MKKETIQKVMSQVIYCQDGSPFIPQYPGGVNVYKCTFCRKCIEVCPSNCFTEIEIDGRKVVEFSNWQMCIGDGMCKIVCPEDAIT